MKWEEKTLSDVADIFSGYAFKSLDMNLEKGIPLIKIKNIFDKQVSTECDAYLNADIANNKFERFVLRDGDFLVAMTGQGSVGRIGKMRSVTKKYYVNQRVAIVRTNPNIASPDFIFYQIATDATETTFFNKANGAGQPNISAKQIGETEISLPSIEIQKRIADILSNYDKLIENNQKQIKLLEETAQRLYKEWFVDFHFPGYEDTEIVDGVPEGWNIKTIKDVAWVNKENITRSYSYDYVDYVDLSSVNTGEISSQTRYKLDEAPGRAKRIAKDGDIIWGMVRPNLKAYSLVQYPSETDVFSTGFAVIHARSVPFSYLYCCMTTDHFVGYLVNCTNGAAYPAVKPIHFEQAKLCVPTDKLLRKFNELTEPLLREIGKLQDAIQKASEARDRLLPKLMSGELEV